MRISEMVGVMGIAVLAGCAGDPGTAAHFRAGPVPQGPGATRAATASVGVLGGEVYMADHAALDSTTGLPTGYRLLESPGALVTVRASGDSRRWQAALATGSYLISGLPVGPVLTLTVSNASWPTRSQTTILPASGVGRVSFEYVDGGPLDSYMLPGPATLGGF